MRKVICIIDDDPIYQVLVSKIVQLSKIDYTIISFKNGKEAIDNFNSCLVNNTKLPNIILLDIEMPLMDGWDFMERMDELISKYQISDTKIYIVSSSISYEDVEKAKLFKNILGYYSKPINSNDIISMIENN
jgi:CheY-like chemotaxis protein